MHRFYTVPLLLVSSLLFAQGTISVDAVPVMHVCGDKNLAASDSCATSPRSLSKTNPTYPETARRSHIEGMVVLGLTVGKDGSRHDLHIVKSPSDDLSQAAMAAVSQWKFEPGTYQGNPVDVELNVEVNFRLERKSSPTQGSSPGTGADQVRNLYTDAYAAYKNHEYQTAVNLARRITELSPQYTSGWSLLGDSLLAMNQSDAAAAAFETQIKLDPSSPAAYNNLGRVYWRQHKYEDAAAQFRKQIVINPEDHYAHANLGMMLRDQKKCKDAMPELEKALTITPGHVEALLAQGECDLDLGNQAKGISELEQATNGSSAPNVFNSAAYSLAKRNIELDRAEKWSETSLTIESARLSSVSLDKLTAEQLNYVVWIAEYWDTRGWVYFLRGDNAKAQSYIEAAWSLMVHPAIGSHLGQIYENLGRREDAIHMYAMAIASADLPTRSVVDPDDAADAKQRLEKLVGPRAKVGDLINRGRTDLAAKTAVSIANVGKSSGSADFAFRLAGGEKPQQIRQISGDASLAKFADSLQLASIPIRIPQGAAVEIPFRGTLTCHSDENECHLALLSSEAAVDVARKEAASDTTALADTSVADPHSYNNPAMGMRISLADEWKLLKEERGSFSRPYNVMFNKPGSLGFFMLTREHLEGTPALYKQMIESGMSQRPEYKLNSEETVTHDGLTGTRWSASWKENGGVVYSSITEIFTVGDDHYRLTALAPKEVFDRYGEAFENMFRSVQFPMLHTDPRVLEGLK